jgi:IS5 family transposase
MGKGTRLRFAGHVLMENRHGLAVDVELTQATGTSEREAAMTMLRRTRTRRRRCTLGADKGYDTREFVDRCKEMGVVPHIAMRESWWANAHLARLKETSGYQVSQRRRKRVEEIFGWARTVGGGRKLRYLGVERNRLWAELTAAAFNMVRMSNLVEVPT